MTLETYLAELEQRSRAFDADGDETAYYGWIKAATLSLPPDLAIAMIKALDGEFDEPAMRRRLRLRSRND